MKKIILVLLVCCFDFVHAQTPPTYEFRAVWVATVVNIDWPAEKGLPVEEQRASFIRLLDMHQKNGMNAVIVQVRPAADAFYLSKYEPWSEYLSGHQGTSPFPYYDPLEFMITETHRRGMEFHAWLNPYRAVFNINTSSVISTHITHQHPEWFLTYGSTKYFNPGLPEVRTFVTDVVKDLVSRYDIDAVHLDDYFYPYRITGKEFPDEKTFRKYGHGLEKENWRRSNCDSIILQLSSTIKSIKPELKFGISPFGVWRNKSKDPAGSDTRAGVTDYDDLYADIMLWLKKGWIDYVVPQLYWEHGHRLCDYDTLLAWWNAHTYGRHLYIGHAIERAGTNAAWRNKNELPAQIRDLRNYSTTQGSAFFSSKIFERNPNGWNDSLRLNYYAMPAIVPPMPWLDDVIPDMPSVKKERRNQYRIEYNGEKKMRAFALYTVPAQGPADRSSATLIQLIPSEKSIMLDRSQVQVGTDQRLFVAVVSRGNNVSDWVEIR